jgi:hypothetical protein
LIANDVAYRGNFLWLSKACEVLNHGFKEYLPKEERETIVEVSIKRSTRFQLKLRFW